jgi:large subunit ribosomal protein L25
MAQTTLAAEPRAIVGKKTKRLRKAGIIPANIYGHKQDSMAIQVNAEAFELLRRKRSLRNIISLDIPGKQEPETVLVRRVQIHSVTNKILHIDFSRVNMQERIEVKIPLHFTGEAPGIKIHSGVLLRLLEALPVTCKAADITEALEVDISTLTEIESALHARDIKLPEGYELAVDPGELIAKIAPPRAVAAATVEATAAAATPAGAAPAAGKEAKAGGKEAKAAGGKEAKAPAGKEAKAGGGKK